jgi:hypothetical protein
MADVTATVCGAAVCAALLAGCANQASSTAAVLSVEAVYSADLTAELAYVSSSEATAAGVAQLKADRLAAAAIVDPLASEASAGTLPSDVSLLGADAALATYSTDEAKYGLAGSAK